MSVVQISVLVEQMVVGKTLRRYGMMGEVIQRQNLGQARLFKKARGGRLSKSDFKTQSQKVGK